MCFIIVTQDHTTLFLQICFMGILFKNRVVLLQKLFQGYIFFVFWGTHSVDVLLNNMPVNEKAQCVPVELGCNKNDGQKLVISVDRLYDFLRKLRTFNP